MKPADWKRAITPYLDEGWGVSRTLAYRLPVSWNVFGLLGEGSGRSDEAFYVWLVRLPLFVPTDVVDLSWSERIGGSSRTFEPSDPLLPQEFVAARQQVDIEHAGPSVALAPPGGADNVRMQEARAYAVLIEGNPGGAVEVLDRVARYEKDAEYPWEFELLERAASVRSMITAGETRDALTRLEDWRGQTLAALGMTER